MITTRNVAQIEDLATVLESLLGLEIAHTVDEMFLFLLVDFTGDYPQVHLWGIPEDDEMYSDYVTRYVQMANDYYCEYVTENPHREVKTMVLYSTNDLPYEYLYTFINA